LEMHSNLKWGQKPETEFKEQLSNVKVSLHYAPSMDEILDYVPNFMLNTWNEDVQTDFTKEERIKCMQELFRGEILPTGMETIELVFSIEGMDMIDTTHLIRHRLFSYSAQAHGDRDIRHDDCMVKSSIMESQYYDRYKEIVEAAKELYCEMVDSAEIHALDARTIMPRNLKHFYFMKGNVKDFMGYIRLRLDEQIQTTVDNVIALQMLVEIVRQFPILKGVINPEQPDAFYCKQTLAGKTNIFAPNDKNRIAMQRQMAKTGTIAWDPKQFIYAGHRDEYGETAYQRIRSKLIDELNSIHNPYE